METPVLRKFIVRYVKAYISVFAVIGVVVAISEFQGAGWRPALAGVPAYISLFALVTYAMVRELRELRKDGNRDKS
ncbi:putative membrane protein [Paraburkholderia xenovorans LB400]|nr:putative membrane protein [Paraburkholderia xenovorans LB400]